MHVISISATYNDNVNLAKLWELQIVTVFAMLLDDPRSVFTTVVLILTAFLCVMVTNKYNRNVRNVL